jgi:1-acyl-sn-glycerol-3-phosphate acyltransferase
VSPIPFEHQAINTRQQIVLALMKLFGWKSILAPAPGKKFVALGYPHTSNWDFIPAVAWAWSTGLKMNFVGKAALFKGIMGPIMKALGGIPLERDKSKNFVDQIVEIIKSRDEIALIVAAEGTRKKAEYWRSGFYYMALEANVPIGLAYMDWKRREIGIKQYLMPSGDLEKDFEIIKAYYQDVTGRDPSKQSPIALKPKDS